MLPVTTLPQWKRSGLQNEMMTNWKNKKTGCYLFFNKPVNVRFKVFVFICVLFLPTVFSYAVISFSSLNKFAIFFRSLKEKNRLFVDKRRNWKGVEALDLRSIIHQCRYYLYRCCSYRKTFHPIIAWMGKIFLKIVSVSGQRPGRSSLFTTKMSLPISMIPAFHCCNLISP